MRVEDVNEMAAARPWCLLMGEGPGLTLVLPRKDAAPLSMAEWEQTLRPFWQDSRYLILDLPEKWVQERPKHKAYTVQELAAGVHQFLQAHDLKPDAIWGFSLGGMMAQELSVLAGMQGIPLVLISTNAYADEQLLPVFSAWSLMAESFGVPGLHRILLPWINKRSELPLLSLGTEVPSRAADDELSVAKAMASLHAIIHHDARPRLGQVQAPVLVLFGEESVLLNEPQAEPFREHLPHAQVTFISGAGMRVMSDHQEEAARVIRAFLTKHGSVMGGLLS